MLNPKFCLDAQNRSEDCISINQGLTVLSISLLVQQAQKPKENVIILFQQHNFTMLLASSLDAQYFLSLVLWIPNLNIQKTQIVGGRTTELGHRYLKLQLQPKKIEFKNSDMKEIINKQRTRSKSNWPCKC
jgi:hypothetical protein